MEQKIIRCAVYTRKSTEEGLDKEFNTLEAQREAGENYIKSQKNQGWVLIPEYYDYGGYHSNPRKVRNSSGEVALSFNHAMINNMLRNPIYIGKVPYKGELFDGLHEAIIPMELWKQVQELKRLNRGDRFAPSRSFKNSLLI